MGEQVAAAVGKSWLDGVFVDLEGAGYSCEAAVLPACAVDAPHRRDRLWFVADADSAGRSAGQWDDTAARHGHSVAAACGADRGDVADTDEPGSQGRGFYSERRDQQSAWAGGVEWAIGADGKARRVKPGIRLLAHGVPARVGRLRAYGNAIVPQVAAEVIQAFMECRP
jgi:DNA (cytosine-5)-methyltransferase 1